MVKLKLDESRCKSCGYCVITCPKKAISFSGRYNEASYDVIQVDDALCVKCGACYTVCPDGVFHFYEED